MADPIQEDEDFVGLKRFNYSLKEALERYPEGVPDHLIAQALAIDEEDVLEMYEKVVEKLRTIMKVAQ